MPLPTLIVVGAAVVSGVTSVLAWLEKRREAKKKEESERIRPLREHPIPNEVIIAVAHLRAHHATAEEIKSAADHAEKSNHARLALALRNEAAVLAAAEKFSAELGKDVPAEPMKFVSPLSSVSDEAWTKYVKQSRTHRRDAVSDNFRLGTYQLSARDLADAGFMVSAKKVDEDGRSVWVGEWVPGKSLEDFLASTEQQYEAFVALSKMHAEAIAKRHADVIGSTTESQGVTLSGLMAVARKAGLGGLASWLKSAKERSTFRATTERYEKLNGIF